MKPNIISSAVTLLSYTPSCCCFFKTKTAPTTEQFHSHFIHCFLRGSPGVNTIILRTPLWLLGFQVKIESVRPPNTLSVTRRKRRKNVHLHLNTNSFVSFIFFQARFLFIIRLENHNLHVSASAPNNQISARGMSGAKVGVVASKALFTSRGVASAVGVPERRKKAKKKKKTLARRQIVEIHGVCVNRLEVKHLGGGVCC